MHCFCCLISKLISVTALLLSSEAKPRGDAALGLCGLLFNLSIRFGDLLVGVGAVLVKFALCLVELCTS